MSLPHVLTLVEEEGGTCRAAIMLTLRPDAKIVARRESQPIAAIDFRSDTVHCFMLRQALCLSGVPLRGDNGRGRDAGSSRRPEG